MVSSAVIFDYQRLLRKQEYGDYLDSPHWHSIRRRMRKKYPCCMYCGATEDDTQLDIAHVSYANRGHENIDKDLVRLCHDHHFQMDSGQLSKAEVVRRRDAYKKKRKQFPFSLLTW